MPDPASRFQPQDVHGPSEVIDPRAYRWEHTNWHGRPWEETVLYELHVGAMGGYAGVQKRLPALAALGVTAIELMPLNDFPGKHNWGYDGVLPYAPDSAYGRPDELKALIDAAHGLGLMVFLDVVYNHFGPDGNYLHAYAKLVFPRRHAYAVGSGDRFRTQRSERLLHGQRASTGSTNIASTACVSTRCTRSTITRGCANCPTISARKCSTAGMCIWCWKTSTTRASLLETHFDAQWNDDAHNTLHVLLTGETEGYYHAYEDQPIRPSRARAVAKASRIRATLADSRRQAARRTERASAAHFVRDVLAEPRSDRQPRDSANGCAR